MRSSYLAKDRRWASNWSRAFSKVFRLGYDHLSIERCRSSNRPSAPPVIAASSDFRALPLPTVHANSFWARKEASSSGQRKGVRAMADPRCFLRPSLPVPQAYQSLALFPSTGGFLPPAPLRASSLSPLALRLGVGALSIRFDKVR